MGSVKFTVMVVSMATLLVMGFQGRSQAVSSVTNDLDDLDLTPEEREVMTHEADDGSDFNYDALGAAADEKDVVVLGSKDFKDFVRSKQYVLVEFYAPWCGHCQSLAPEYAKAATALKDTGVVLAKIDAVEHTELAQDYEVQGYPTLFFFIDGEKVPYKGGRTSNEIVNWVKKRIGPLVTVVKSAAQAEEELDSETPLAVAYLESIEGADAEELIAVARQVDGVEFYMTADEQIAKKFSLDATTPALVLLKKQNEKIVTFDGSFERKALEDFVTENKLPLVIPFNRDSASDIFESDVSRQLLLFAHRGEFEKIRANYEEAAKSFKKKIMFVLVDLADEEIATPVLEYFALDAEKTRLMAFVSEESGAKYLYDGDYSVDSIMKFSEKFLTGDLPLYRKSEMAPEKNDEPVKIVVASTFDEIVLDESKDVILEVYAPWCGHCQALEPEYNRLGEALENISSIVIAKMDGTKNEHELLKIEGFPTILFYPAGNRSAEPTPLDTERSAAGIIRFLKSNAVIPFEAPDVPEPEEPESEPVPEYEEESEEEADAEEEGGEVEGDEEKESSQGEAETDVKDEL